MTCTGVCSPAELQHLLAPRCDVVVEEFDTAAGGHAGGEEGADTTAPPDAAFRAIGGPFRHYRRAVHILQRGDRADLVRRRIGDRLPAVVRPWILDPLVDRELRRPRTGQGGDSYLVRQRITYQLSVPVWSWFLTPLTNRQLRRPRTDGRQPFWAPAERLDPRSGQVVGVLCLLSVVAGYLGTLLSQTITFAFDEFGAGLTTQGNTLTAVRVGVLLALGLVALADHRGRRPVLLFSATAGCLVAAMGAASLGVWTYGASQLVSRSLSTAMLVLLLVLAAEEVPAGARAYAVSVLTMAAGLGSGMVVWLLPLADLGLRAWRILFLAPLLGLPLLVFCARRLPESRRFSPPNRPHGSATAPPLGLEATPDRGAEEPDRAESGGQADVAEQAERAGDGEAAGLTGAPAVKSTGRAATGPAGDAPRPAEADRHARRTRRLTLLGIGALFFSLFAAPASQYLNEFLRTERSFSAGNISVFQLSINTPAAIGVLIGGRFSDVRGRRRIGALGLAAGTAFTVLRYTHEGWPMWMWGVLAAIFGAASVPVMGAFGAELFGTSNRARSNGQITVLGVIGSMIGLQIVGRLTDAGGDFADAFALVAGAPLLVALLVLFAFPETASRELEDLNPEDVRPGGGSPPTAPE